MRTKYGHVKGLAYLARGPYLVNVHCNDCLTSLSKTCTRGNQCMNEEAAGREGSAPVKAEPVLPCSPQREG